MLHTASFGRFGEIPHSPVSMNLRLPGQYADQETGLHYNLHRYYDPRAGEQNPSVRLQRVSVSSGATHGQGRYLTPDPLGHPDGPDPYLYASGDPINRIDSRGLYQEDVHYYLTYFLALMAGLTERQAFVIATANRYIDDNPNTEPYGTLGTNLTARYYYHFTQDGWDRSSNPVDRYLNPQNPQITALHEYATTSASRTPETEPTPCARAQLYGEYLHAFMDTFSHRDANNVPYGARGGHLSGGENPDNTYNHVDMFGRNWQYNEARTVAMERAVFEQLQRDFGRQAVDRDGFPIDWSYMEVTLQEFNRDQTTEPFAILKAERLNDKLTELGLPAMRKYDCNKGRDERNQNLRDINGRPLDQRDYAGTILNTPTANQSCK